MGGTSEINDEVPPTPHQPGAFLDMAARNKSLHVVKDSTLGAAGSKTHADLGSSNPLDKVESLSSITHLEAAIRHNPLANTQGSEMNPDRINESPRLGISAFNQRK